MIETAENLGKEGGFAKKQCDDLVLKRWEYYGIFFENDKNFKKNRDVKLDYDLKGKDDESG